MNGNFFNIFKRKFPTKETPLSAATAKIESIAMEMRNLAKEINTNQTIISCIRLAVWDMVCPLHAPVMIWYCYSNQPIPGTEHTPSYPQIHQIKDLWQGEKMFGFSSEELKIIENYFEATQKLNALAKAASKHYMNLHFNS